MGRSEFQTGLKQQISGEVQDLVEEHGFTDTKFQECVKEHHREIQALFDDHGEEWAMGALRYLQKNESLLTELQDRVEEHGSECMGLLDWLNGVIHATEIEHPELQDRVEELLQTRTQNQRSEFQTVLKQQISGEVQDLVKEK